jgi:hypothetical protein
MSESPDHLDYEWHFKLAGDEDEHLHSDALTEMVRRQLKALLGCVVLTADGVDLRATGFRFLADPNAEHAIYPEVAMRRPTATEAPSPGQADDALPGSEPQGEGDGTLCQ